MKIDWEQKILNWDGKEIHHNDKIVTLGQVAKQALEAGGTKDHKYYKGECIEKINSNKDFEEKDITFIKDEICNVMSVLFTYRAWNLLNEYLR